jgi:hypothetical protein
MSYNNISKSHQFEILNEFFNLKIPKNNYLRDLGIKDNEFAVIYLNNYSHRGADKILRVYSEALTDYKDNYASQYIGADYRTGMNSVSYRHLQVGARAWRLKYISKNSWQSNNAEKIEIEILEEAEPLLCYSPLFAIDFVEVDNLYAIDFNTSPGIKGTGLEDIISAQEIYNLIELGIKK